MDCQQSHPAGLQMNDAATKLFQTYLTCAHGAFKRTWQAFRPRPHSSHDCRPDNTTVAFAELSRRAVCPRKGYRK
jgi:hypothetical protein